MPHPFAGRTYVVGVDPASRDGPGRVVWVRIEPDGRRTVLDALVLDDHTTFTPADAMPISTRPAAAPAQTELLPHEMPACEVGVRPLAFLEWTAPGPLDPDFLESVRTMGIMQSLAVVQVGRGVRARYRVAAGRRRAQAAREVGIAHVPCLIFPPGTPETVARAAALVENMHRRPNPVSDLEAIEELNRLGFTFEQVATALHLSVSTLRQRARLIALTAPLRERLRRGQLSLQLAGLVAGWTEAEQAALDAATRGRRVVVADVRTRQDAQRRTSAVPYADESEEMFAPAEMGEGRGRAPVEAWESAVVFGRRFPQIRYDGQVYVAAQAIQHAVQAYERTTVTQTEAPLGAPAGAGDELAPTGWPGVLLLLAEAERVMPVAPDDRVDGFYVALEDLRERIAAIQARAEAPAEAAPPAGRSL